MTFEVHDQDLLANARAILDTAGSAKGMADAVVFAGTQYIDEVEALCVELLKQAFRSNYADHRLMGSMLGNMAVYHALAQPGDAIMSAPQPFGGHSSNRVD